MRWTTVWQFLKSNSIVRAFALSILIHVLAYFLLPVTVRLQLLKFLMPQRPRVAQKVDLNQRQQEQQIPLVFIQVDDTKAEEPKDAKYYSSANSQAANPDTHQDTATPKIDGTQDKVPKIRDVAKATTPPPQTPQPLQPAVKPSPQPPKKPDEPVGDTKENTLTAEEKAQRDLKMDRPSPASQPQQPRPRTLAQAREQKGLPGEKMKQDGGVKKYSLEMSPAAKMTPFGSYDAAFIAAVQSRWYQILEQREYAYDRSGKVVVDFRLYKDGTIRNLTIPETEVPETLSWACQRAILDPAPYAPFPPDLRRLLGTDFREVRFTFYYE